jgi:hypothetical protein
MGAEWPQGSVHDEMVRREKRAYAAAERECARMLRSIKVQTEDLRQVLTRVKVLSASPENESVEALRKIAEVVRGY